MGLSFAIPIEMAMDVANQLRVSGKVSRGWLGVIIQEVTMELSESFGMDRAFGALVTKILPDSPASKSALQIGDVITHFDGRQIERSSSLPPLVGRVPANSDAKVKVVREGKSIELFVNIGVLPTNDEIRSSAQKKLSGGPAEKAGIRSGDVISMIDNKAVDSSEDVSSVLSELDGRKSVAVLVHRDEGPVFLALQIDD